MSSGGLRTMKKQISLFNFFSNYKGNMFQGDFTAGLIVAILFIPQSMAYAIIAGVPPVVGLYAGTFPLIIYALFGSSKYLSVGPVSVVALIAFSGIGEITDTNTAHFFHLIILLGMIVGILQILMGLVKIGNLFNFVSPAVLSGFTSAVAIIIALNQIESITGIPLASYDQIYSFANELFYKLKEINIYTLTISIISFAVLIYSKKKLRIAIGPLIVILISTFLVYYFKLFTYGVAIVGEVPKGLPNFSVPSFSYESIKLLLPVALTIALISFMESYVIAKTFADKQNEAINPNRELFGLGMTNISSSMIGSIPIAGAISRTSVNYHSGAKTKISSLITAAIIFLTLLFFTPIFYYLPKATLAAIIIIAVLHLIDMKYFLVLTKTMPMEATIFLLTFISTLAIDVIDGLIIGIACSLIYSLFKKVIFKIVYKRI
jgi:SulP family sulfate permease